MTLPEDQPQGGGSVSTFPFVSNLPSNMTANKRVPNSADSSLTVVQASTGDIVATISANASLLSGPTGASFDGEQVPVANSSGNSVTLFKAADLSVLGDVTTRSSTSPFGPCSDGIASGWGVGPVGEQAR